jgi:hypothetical protein
MANIEATGRAAREFSQSVDAAPVSDYVQPRVRRCRLGFDEHCRVLAQ